MPIAALVLAAGGSTRLGQPKQLVKLSEASPETLLQRAVRIARAAGLSPVVVVLGAHAEAIQAAAPVDGALVLINSGWAEGMGSSIRAGIGAIAHLDVGGCVVLTCDMPAVTAQHLRLLIQTARQQENHQRSANAGVREDLPVVSSYSERRGVPAYFSKFYFAHLHASEGDVGARVWLRNAPAVELAGGALDVDTPEDVVRAREWLASARGDE
jgi:molybdenum cofactor cytidylyltransferase